MIKSYYLFKWRVWSIVVEPEPEVEEVEEVEPGTGALNSYIAPAGDWPGFGFITNTPYYDDEE